MPDVPMHTQPLPRILIVDDEFDIAATYAMLFEYHGYAVTSAANGRDALAQAALAPPAIVLSDYMMPHMNGGELCRRWRADPALRHIPFILTSAGIIKDQASIECDVFLTKPVRFELLLGHIDRLCGRTR
jgi:CheY-like chemotaxis protein